MVTRFFEGAARARGLARTDAETVLGLCRLWSDKLPRNMLRERYYLAQNSLKRPDFSIPPEIRHLEQSCGWARKAVDVMVEHSKLDGFTAEDDEITALLFEMVQRNHLRTKYRKATTSALKQCFNLYLVTSDDAGLSRVSAYPASASAAVWNDAADELESAMFVVSTRKSRYYQVNGNGSAVPDWIDVAAHDYLIRLRCDEGGEWNAEYVRNGLGHLPVFAAPYEATLERPLGTSRITREVMGLMDDAVRLFINSEVASCFAASTQRYLLGTDKDPFEGQAWNAAMGAILNVDINSEGNAPVYGQLAQPSMQPLTDHLNNLISRMAAATGVHASQLGKTATGNPASSDAIYAENEPLVLKVRDWNEDVSAVLVDVATACVATERGMTFDQVRAQGLGIEARFRDPAMPTLAQETDSAVKIASVIPAYAGTETFWERLGFNEEQRRRVMRELRRANGLMITSDLLGNVQGGAVADAAAS